MTTATAAAEKGGFIVPASTAQERLWFVDQLEPGNPFYNVAQAIRVRGALDVEALRDTLAEIVQRHESLRTTFPSVGGRPRQVIAPRGSVHLEVSDRAGQNEGDALSLVQDEVRRPFDLTAGPLFRARLIRLSPEEHILVLTTHHIVSDGWSVGVLYRELGALYDAFSRGLQSPLPALPIQYADYAVWQREQQGGAIRDKQLAYWREQLADLPPSFTVPGDRSRPMAQTYSGNVLPVRLSPELTQGLKNLSQKEGVTLFMTLLAAFQTLLFRYTGQDDVVVGSPIAGRSRVELEGLIGFFVNTLVLRTDFEGEPTFRQLLGGVRRVALGAYAHSDLPFERLVEDLAPERTLSGNPLFQVAFVLQNQPRTNLVLSGLQLSPLPVHTGTTKFDLSLSLGETPDGLEGRLEYATDIFDAETIQRMVAHFECLLAGIVADPDREVTRLPLLRQAERERILVEWNQTESEFPSDQCVHQLIESRARQSPEAIAVLSAAGALSYRDLDARANQLARRLRAFGVAREDRVAVALERGPELPIALLGILKAGAAYVPLDPASPQERIAYVLGDSGAKLLLTGRDWAESFDGARVRTFRMDRDRDALALESAEAPRNRVTPESLAYLIYTSGSTGRPKGVMLSHRSVVNYLWWTLGAYRMHQGRGALLHSPIAFDLTVTSLFAPLLAGRAVVVAPEVDPVDALGDALRVETDLSLVKLVPSQLELLRQQLAPDDLRGATRSVVIGGEALSWQSVTFWQEAAPETRFFNEYGPTEAAVGCCVYELAGETRSPGAVPIGRPIANTRLHVLDAHLQPVPVGIAGELYIGGEGLARGYHNRPDLTAERFVPDPFAARGTRLYQSGDLARYRADGTLDFLGRRDHQIKIRGFRIELGEIEAVAAQHLGVGECVVLAREEVGTGKRLIAYVTARAESPRGEAPVPPEGDPVRQWQLIHEETHRQPEVADDPEFDIAGWNSSYTGLPIPEEEMREWVDHTVERILPARPRRVLEIGCGSGLLLYRIAPHCERYEGADFSEAALAKVGRQLARDPARWGHVSLSLRMADDFRGWEPGAFDAIVLNSVIQYFPDAGYLLRVLEGALEVVAPGGFVFVGDVRSLPLLEAFHTSVQLSRARASESLAELERLVRRNVRHEAELVVDPGFFHALARRLPGRIAAVQVQPKRGHASNEMTRYRYDVLLRAGKATGAETPLEWRPWAKEEWTLERLRALLTDGSPETLGFSGVPNARVATDVDARARLEAGAGRNVGELRDDLARHPVPGVDPQDLETLARDLGYRTELSWASGDPEGRFDVFLRRTGSAGPAPAGALVRFPVRAGQALDAGQCTNDPRRGQIARQLGVQLRNHLAERLPAYMVPSATVVLDEFPLNVHGKVDRQALPEPDSVRPDLEEAYVAPRDSLEQEIVRIWGSILGIERVGVEDNFFALGGHSLLATQVVSRIRAELGLDLPLRALFEAPTVAALAASLSTRAEAKEEQQNLPVLRPVPRAAPLPLSFAQQRLWFLDQLKPGSFTYNVPHAQRIVGNLDRAALERALQEIVRRHETLRTRFRLVGEEPMQVVGPASAFSLHTADLEELPDEEREREARRIARDEATRPFDLAQGPLFRARLIRLAPKDHVLLMTMHHIVSDGWSASILFRELAALYAAYRENRPSPLPELPVQYADYALWQRGWLKGEALEQRLAYWRTQLAGASPFLDFPAARTRPAEPRSRGEHFPMPIPPEIAVRLKEFSDREHATPFMTALAIFQTLLSIHTGREDIVVGTDVANRMPAAVEGLIGFFVNLLVLRTDLTGQPTFRQVVSRVREVALAAYAHQDLPFEKLVEELKPARDLRRNPLAQVLFVQTTERLRLELLGLETRPFTTGSDSSRFDLVLFLSEDGKSGDWLYDPDIFDREFIATLSADFCALMTSGLAEPDRPLNSLPARGEPQRRARTMAHDPPQRQRRLSVARRKAVDVTSTEEVKTSALSPGAPMPLLVEPRGEEMDLVEWAGANRPRLEEWLLRHGVLLFRGFDVRSVDRFEQFAQRLCPELFGEYGDLPREGVAGKVYGSTPYPADEMILYHNESSHLPRWPMKIWFFCVEAARTGGETPVVDCRRVYDELDPGIREAFSSRGLLYVRNYTAGMDVSWQSFFGTSEKTAVEEQCRLAGVESEWTPEGLRTRQHSPAVVRHPRTGEPVFFNQLFLHHPSCLAAPVRESLVSMLGEENLPRNVFYGDGSPIPDAVVTGVRGVYDRLAVGFPWREGDILMVNNMLAAHARRPFGGPRKIVVAMGEMVEKSAVESLSSQSPSEVRSTQ